jgi:hypothetical protein
MLSLTSADKRSAPLRTSTGFVAIKRVGSSSLGLSVSSEIVLFDPAGLASLIDVPRSRD